MQETLSRSAASTNWLRESFARVVRSAKRLAPAPQYDRDMVLTDELERELARREFQRWH